MNSSEAKYYVYVRPGQIEYFDDLAQAQNYATSYNSEITEL